MLWFFLKSATSISKTSDIAVQRDHFKHLSSHLVKAVKLFGVDQTVYEEFCPMANDNKKSLLVKPFKGNQNS
ncbi:MAG: DUF3347 domain-containing protein [Bacteroidota bacterium]